MIFSSIFDEEKSTKFGYTYLGYVGIMAILIGILKFAESDAASYFVMGAHIPSSLIMITLPILTFTKKITGWTSILVSIGGIIMSIAGVLLALLKTDNPPLEVLEIFEILPILLLLASACFAFGFLLTEKWTFAVPFIKIGK